MQTYPRVRARRKLPNHLQVIVGVKAKNRFRKLIRITGTRFTRKRRNDNWMSGPHFDLGHVLGRLVRLGVALSPAVIKPRLTAGIDPTHRLFLGSSLENFFRGSAFKRGPYGPYRGMRYPSDDQFWFSWVRGAKISVITHIYVTGFSKRKLISSAVLGA